MILIGGSNVFDSGRRRPLGALRLLQVLYPAWAADRLGIPVDLFGHTLGPFRTRLSRAIARRILRKARFIVLREESSLSVAVELDRDLASRCRVEPDMAFAVRRPTPEQVVTVMARYGLIRSRYLVLVPRAHPYGSAAQTDRVLAEMARAGRATLSAGLVDVVVVLSQCLGPTTIEDDRPVAARLANLLPADSRLLIEDDLSVTELVGLLGGAAAVLSVRLHGAILAMSAGTPAHAIAYFTGKTAGVLAQCGMSNRWSEFADFTAECVTNLADIKERAAVALVAERERGRLDRLAGELAQ